LPLSGNTADVGRSLDFALKMAVKDYKWQSQAVDVNLMPCADTACDPIKAATTMMQLANKGVGELQG